MKITCYLLASLLASNFSQANPKSVEVSKHLLPLKWAMYVQFSAKPILVIEETFKEPSVDNIDSTKSTQAVVERFNAAFNRHDVEAVMANMTDDCIFENTNPAPDGTLIKGATEVRAYWERFFKNNPDAYFEAEEIITAGDRCIVRWIYRKTKDGQPWHLRGVDIFKVRDGKVAEKFAYVKG